MAEMKRDRLPGEKEDGDLEFPFEFPLKKPIPVKEDRSSALVLEEPSAELVLKHNLLYGMSNDSALPVIAAMSGATETAIKANMIGTDLIRLVALLSRFFSAAAR